MSRHPAPAAPPDSAAAGLPETPNETSDMTTTLKPADVVRIVRPGRQWNGWIGRFMEVAQDQGFAWVALSDKANVVPDERIYRQSGKAKHKLLPISQLEKTV